MDQIYTPVIIQLPDLKKDIFDEDGDPEFSMTIEYPKFSYGFHHFIHQTKDKAEIFQQFEDRKRPYLIMNKFEPDIDNYEEGIHDLSKKYFDIDSKSPDIVSDSFYKLWEILFMFDLVPTTGNFTSAHIAEAPGAFIQATMFYRDMFAKSKSKQDKYYAVSLHTDTNRAYIQDYDKSFVDYHGKEKPQRVIIHKTYTTKESEKSADKDNGDLTDPKTRRNFISHFKTNKADFITSDGGFEWLHENVQEQEASCLILGQIITALEIQAKDGSLVLKIYETFTTVTVKYLCILSSFYDNVTLVKPLTSTVADSEKYVVCTGFKYAPNDKEKDKKIKVLDELQRNCYNEVNRFMVSIFPKYDIPDNFLLSIIKINKLISNPQFQIINEMVDFVNKQNYRGELYENKRKEQIDSAKYWTDRFLIELKEFDKLKKKIIIETKQNID